MTMANADVHQAKTKLPRSIVFANRAERIDAHDRLMILQSQLASRSMSWCIENGNMPYYFQIMLLNRMIMVGSASPSALIAEAGTFPTGYDPEPDMLKAIRMITQG